MDRVTRLVPVLVGGFIIGVALGMLAGIVFFNDYITTHTEACEDELHKCIDYVDQQDPLVKYNGNLSFMNFSLEHEGG